MSATTVAAAVLAALPLAAKRVALVAPARSRMARALAVRLPNPPPGGAADAAVVCCVGWCAAPPVRQGLLSGVCDRLVAGGTVVLVDHNQPRTWVARLIGAALLATRGFGPARARYPAARELAALGCAVEALHLARGERVQIVVARRP